MFYTIFRYNVFIVLSILFVGAGCVNQQSVELVSDKVMLSSAMPEDVSITWYRYIKPEKALREGGAYKSEYAEITVEGGVYTLDIGGKKEDIMFEVTRDEIVQLYRELKKLRVDEITTNTKGYDGDNISIGIDWGENFRVSVNTNQIDYIDYEWIEAFGSAAYLIESFVIERVE